MEHINTSKKEFLFFGTNFILKERKNKVKCTHTTSSLDIAILNENSLLVGKAYVMHTLVGYYYRKLMKSMTCGCCLEAPGLLADGGLECPCGVMTSHRLHVSEVPVASDGVGGATRRGTTKNNTGAGGVISRVKNRVKFSHRVPRLSQCRTKLHSLVESKGFTTYLFRGVFL